MSHSSWEILRNTVRKDGAEIWFSFNPKGRHDPVYADFVANTSEGAWVRRVNYTDNPWFPGELDMERRADERDQPERYSHIWLGEPDDVADVRKVLPYAMLRRCVDAWDLRPPASGVVHAVSYTHRRATRPY